MKVTKLTLIVDGQRDDLILGSNIIKHLIHVLKAYGDHVSIEEESLQQLLATVQKWRNCSCFERIPL